jgi:hypothetical protein
MIDFDNRPVLGTQGTEPSVRELLTLYYSNLFNDKSQEEAEKSGKKLADAYIDALGK